MAKSFLNKPGYPRGLRNNNPGNITVGDSWQGMIGTDGPFVMFENCAYGLRAMAINLRTQIRNGYDTIELIIFRWSPPSENDTLAYIAQVVRETGIPQNRTLTVDGNTLRKLMRAMMNVELGANYSALLTNADIDEGISMMDGSLINAGTVGFGVATVLFGVSLYLLATMEKMPKQKS